MNSLEKFRDVRNFIFALDGVVTNGHISITNEGTPNRNVYSRDEFAIRHALQRGCRVIIFCSGTARGVKERFQSLGVDEFYNLVGNRKERLQELIQTTGLDMGNTLYMGEDIPDYEAMRLVHLPVCPVNASRDIIQLSQYVSPFGGGMGCVRDVIEKALILQEKWWTFNASGI